MRSIARGLEILVRSLRSDVLTYNPSQLTIDCGKVFVVGVVVVFWLLVFYLFVYVFIFSLRMR